MILFPSIFSDKPLARFVSRLFDFNEYVLVKVDEKVHMHMYILSLLASAGQENEHLCRDAITACLGHAWESDVFTIGLLYEALKRCRLPGGLSPQEVFRQSTRLAELLHILITRNPTKAPGVLRGHLVALMCRSH